MAHFASLSSLEFVSPFAIGVTLLVVELLFSFSSWSGVFFIESNFLASLVILGGGGGGGGPIVMTGMGRQTFLCPVDLATLSFMVGYFVDVLSYLLLV